jgi:transposase
MNYNHDKCKIKKFELPNTIENCHDVIKELLAENTNLSVKNTDLSVKITDLSDEITNLKERLNNNSYNSSIPPSKSFKKNKKDKQKSKNKPGGQVGHKGHYRVLLDSENVDAIVECRVLDKCSCGGLIKQFNKYQTHQVYELVKMNMQITEYRIKKGRCSCCYKRYSGVLPQGITFGIIGPNLIGFMSHLISKYKLTRRELKEFLKEHYGFSIGLGTIFNKHSMVSDLLEGLTAEILKSVKQSSSINIDETGHNRDGKKQWLWCFASHKDVFFSVQQSRGKKVLDKFVSDYKGTVISDRYAAYSYFDNSCRQICWAHLKRDFTKLSEKEDKLVSNIGKQLLKYESELFKIWHKFKHGHIKRWTLLNESKPICKIIGELLEQGSYTDPALKAARFCKNLLNNYNALWKFLSTDNVEPTNNHAERCLRHAVIWRKKYFCTRSDYGAEFVARTTSIIMTCKLQLKNSFEYICQILSNHFIKITAPPVCV